MEKELKASREPAGKRSDHSWDKKGRTEKGNAPQAVSGENEETSHIVLRKGNKKQKNRPNQSKCRYQPSEGDGDVEGGGGERGQRKETAVKI